MGVVWRSRKCLPSRIAFSLGVGSTLGPWDLIPNRILVLGHFDELAYILVGLAIARLLIPPQLEYHVAHRLGVADHAHGRRGSIFVEQRLAKVQSELLAQWLVVRRRMLRLGIDSANSVRKVWSRSTAAIACRDVGGFLFTLFGYRLWWCLRSPFTPSRSHRRDIVVVGGAARSGTTLLRTILGRHPLIASGPELRVFMYRVPTPEALARNLGTGPAEIERWQRESWSQMEFIERVQRAILERSGKRLWVEKTPRNVQRFGFVRRHFPYAKLVHIIRDGRDNVCSFRRHPSAKLEHIPWDSPAAARWCAVQWRTNIKAGLRFRGDPAYYELRYEDLVLDPEPTMRALLEFLGVPWDDCILDAAPGRIVDSEEVVAAGEIFGSSIGRWHRDLSPADRNVLRHLIGPLIVELAYENGLDWPDGGSFSQSVQVTQAHNVVT